jgi:hypothetical protein
MSYEKLGLPGCIGSMDCTRILWLAVDGCYQKAACFINPMYNRFAFPEVVFSEWLESIRKDVEYFLEY